MGGGKGRERVLDAEFVVVAQVGDEALALVFVRNPRQQGPECADGAHRKPPSVAVQIVVEAARVVPHHLADAGLQGEVRALVLEAGVLVVEYVADLRQVQGVQRLLGIEVHRVVAAVTRTVAHHGGGGRYRVEPVFLAMGGFQPLVVALQHRQDLAQPLLVSELVVQVELGPGEQRRRGAGGVGAGQHRSAVLDQILAADGAVFLLLLVEGVQLRRHRVDAVAVDQEEGREAGFELVDAVGRGVAEVARGEPVGAGPLVPLVANPRPGTLVQLYQVLVVEVDLREVGLAGPLPYRVTHAAGTVTRLRAAAGRCNPVRLYECRSACVKPGVKLAGA